MANVLQQFLDMIKWEDLNVNLKCRTQQCSNYSNWICTIMKR